MKRGWGAARARDGPFRSDETEAVVPMVEVGKCLH